MMKMNKTVTEQFTFAANRGSKFNESYFNDDAGQPDDGIKFSLGGHVAKVRSDAILPASEIPRFALTYFYGKAAIPDEKDFYKRRDVKFDLTSDMTKVVNLMIRFNHVYTDFFSTTDEENSQTGLMVILSNNHNSLQEMFMVDMEQGERFSRFLVENDNICGVQLVTDMRES